MPMPTVLTRRELYDLVWSRPMRDLAADFGISDVGLAKICARHRIPKPGRGYWAKLQAGRKITKAIFREVGDHALNRIVIRAATQQWPAPAREVIQRAKGERAKARVIPTARAATEPVQDVHPAIEGTVQTLRKAKPDKNGAVRAIGDGLGGVEVAAANVERVIAFLDGLARKLEARSLPLKPTGEAIRVSVEVDSATFTIKEQTRREKHVPTPEDLAAEERRQKKLQRHWQLPRRSDDDDSSLFKRAYPEFDTIYTNALVFQVEGYADGVRRKWADGKTQTVESLLDDIVTGLEALLAVRKAEREAREERERQWREQARRRELARKRAEREEKRVSYVKSLVELGDQIRGLRQWLAQAEPASEARANSDFGRMVEWVRQRLATLEATVDPENVDRNLARKGLFPVVDELHDPERDPPDDPYSW